MTNKERYKAWEREQLAKVSVYSVCLFLGAERGNSVFDTRQCSSLEDAKALRDKMCAEYEGKNYGRRPIIYGITDDHHLSILIAE